MLGNIILYKGTERITFKSFATEIINQYGCVDTYDLTREFADKYGCREPERFEILYRIQDSTIYYDGILDRFYANKDLYYKEIEDGGF